MFVPPVFVLLEMREMLTTWYGANGPWLWTSDLRDYARWEYGRNAEAWILSLKATRRVRGPGLRARVRAWFRLPAIAAVSPTVATVATVENRP